ncbi:hypothetical protein BD779DRAFT_1434155 [Infundibulicybe gibba]|nr:hypothetical protein BD779DRAFT_1434155 [Infundibulicybe gibba]
MSSRQYQRNPWPAATPAPPAPLPSSPSPPPRRSVKRRRIRDTSLEVRGHTSKMARQVVADQTAVADAMTDCQFNSGNNIFSCFPTSDTIIAQHQWATFVWNSRRPELTQTNKVDIFLFHGDSRKQILHFPGVTNPSDQAGSIPAQVNDSWWGDNGTKWNGSNLTYPFYWVIIRSDKTLDGNEIPQSTFSAVQTTFADSVVAAMASSSLASLASASSLSRVTTTSPPSAGTGVSGGNVQSSSNGSDFPHWAIAVIVVLGFLAIAATCVLAFLIIRRVRRRNSEMEAHRNSMGSASPMMEHVGQSPGSPLLAAAAVPARQPSSVGHGGDRQNDPSVVSPDGASTISRAGSAGEGGPFSGADAQIMADAFRKMLRKPDFAGRPVDENDSPENPEAKEELIHRELAEEGRDIRSVSSSRGVRVETMSDSGDTVQDNPH